MTCQYLLSVVVPTHNRADYAVSSIESLLGIEDARLQVVVHDTSTSDELAETIAQRVPDTRLRYVRHRGPLNLTENHNAAMALAEGEYVCLIGDDDTILPEAIEAMEWALRSGVDCVAPRVVANYAWPDFRTRYFGLGHAARLYIAAELAPPQVCSAEAAFSQAMHLAAQDTQNLPKIYHGFVRRQVMDRIRARSGAYFHGSSPDMSGAVALTQVLSSYVDFAYPLTIPGASGKSNSGRSAVRTHVGSLASETQTASSEWPDLVPHFFSVETVWAQAALLTMHKLGRSDRDFNYNRLYAACWMRHRGFRGSVSAALQTAAAALPPCASYSGFSRELIGLLIREGLRLSRRVMRPTAAGGRNYIADIPSIAAAQSAVVGYLDANSICVGNYLKG